MIALGLIWIVAIGCGLYLGRQRDQLVAALLLTLFLGPIGLLIFAFLPNEKQESADHAKHLDSLEEKLSEQRDEQTKQLLDEARAVREGKGPAATSDDLVLRVARQGKDLGEMKLGQIKAMVARQELAMEDYFLDPATNEWIPLEAHPALAAA